MSILLHDGVEMTGFPDSVENAPRRARASAKNKPTDEFPLLTEKLSVPATSGLVERPRLGALLERSLSQCCVTLLSGRAGTGKTALAAEFARTYDKVAWYTLDASDVEWDVFSKYFAAAMSTVARRPSLMRLRLNKKAADGGSLIDKFLIDTFGYMPANRKKPVLVVLDDLHRIFDAEWFGDFFNMLVYSLPENMHLLLLCRSKPPAPLWRLRSKQMLNVIDEKLLAFDDEESRRLLAGSGLGEQAIARLRDESFGRVSKMLEVAGRSAG
ncbi:MAG: AAA family ATPase [Pyrinomonadaceae bacterium]